MAITIHVMEIYALLIGFWEPSILDFACSTAFGQSFYTLKNPKTIEEPLDNEAMISLTKSVLFLMSNLHILKY